MGRRHPNNSNALGTDGISELGQVRGLYGELDPTSPRLNKRGRNQTSWVRSIRVPRDARVFRQLGFPASFRDRPANQRAALLFARDEGSYRPQKGIFQYERTRTTTRALGDAHTLHPLKRACESTRVTCIPNHVRAEPPARSLTDRLTPPSQPVASEQQQPTEIHDDVLDHAPRPRLGRPRAALRSNRPSGLSPQSTHGEAIRDR